MTPHGETMHDILKGLEGLEMLGQWQMSLVKDLRAKAQGLLRPPAGGPGPEGGPAPGGAPESGPGPGHPGV